jgi:hypothetical protein
MARVSAVSSLGKICVIMTVIMMTTASLMPPLPAHLVPFWEDGECQWFNGTITDKRIENDNGITADYIFMVDGSVDNHSDIQMEVYGDALFYAMIPIGATHEGRICDTVELKTAIAEGIIQFIS